MNYESALTNLEKWCEALGQPVGVEEVAKEKVSNVIIYPNPSRGEVIIETKDIINSLSVLDVSGKVIYENRNVNTSKYRLVERMPAGVYLVNVKTENGSSFHKLMIQ